MFSRWSCLQRGGGGVTIAKMWDKFLLTKKSEKRVVSAYYTHNIAVQKKHNRFTKTEETGVVVAKGLQYLWAQLNGSNIRL